MTLSTTQPDLLEAAREIFEQYGVRRANVEDVARAAGISRSTLYRAYPNKERLLEAVLVHEIDEFLTALEEVAADLPPQEAVVECFTRGLTLTREIPLLGRLAETEPELVTAASGAASHSSVVLGSAERVATTLRRSGATMAEEELRTVAELMLRVAWTYLLNPRGGLDVTDETAVRAYARRYLAPLVS